MSKLAGFGTAGETLAVVEAALDHLATLPLAGAVERLDVIARARTAAGRMDSLVSVWVAEADRSGEVRQAAGTTVTDWLSRTTQADPGEAVGILRTGKDLLASKPLKQAATSGKVTPRQLGGIKKSMRELPPNLSKQQRQQAEATLLAHAATMGPAELGKQAKHLTQQLAPHTLPDREAELRALEAQRHRALQRRYLHFLPDGDGSLLIEGSLPVLEGEKLRKLVAGYVASDTSTRRNNPTTERGSGADNATATGKAGAIGAGAAGKAASAGRDLRTREQRNADALIALVDKHGTGTPLPGLVGDRPRIVVTMTEQDLRNRAEQAGHLISGHPIDPGTLRRLCCDTELIPIVLNTDSVPIDVGRAHRLIPADIRLALSLRDGHCQFPGCDVPDEECEAHHITPWWNHGPTALHNLILLCRHHHGIVEPPRFWDTDTSYRWSIHTTNGRPTLIPPTGPAAAGAAEALPRAGP